MKQILSIAVCCLLGISCQQDIDLSHYQGEQQTLVLNCLANSDTTVMASVTTTWPYESHKEVDNISGLPLLLTVNGQPQGLMTYSNGLYRSAVKPQPGDTIRVDTSVDGAVLSAVDVMPQPITITRLEVSHQRVTSSGSTMADPTGVTNDNYDDEFTYHITFANDSTRRLYYFLSISEVDFHQIKGDVDYTYDPVFQVTTEIVNRNIADSKMVNYWGMPFSNEGITTDVYTLNIKETGAPFCYATESGRTRRVMLYAISEAYYKYLITQMANNEEFWQGKFTKWGLAESSRIHTNVSGGTGILACIVPHIVVVRLNSE